MKAPTHGLPLAAHSTPATCILSAYFVIIRLHQISTKASSSLDLPTMNVIRFMIVIITIIIDIIIIIIIIISISSSSSSCCSKAYSAQLLLLSNATRKVYILHLCLANGGLETWWRPELTTTFLPKKWPLVSQGMLSVTYSVKTSYLKVTVFVRALNLK